MPHVRLKLRKATASVADASSTTFGKADGLAISFSTGRMRPKPSKEKKTLEARISASGTGRLDQAPAAMPAPPRSASLRAPQMEPETTAVTMAMVPRRFRKRNCATKRNSAMMAKRGARASVTTSRLQLPIAVARLPATRPTKQQHTPPCRMNTHVSAMRWPHGPRAHCATSARSCTSGLSRARLHWARTSIAYTPCATVTRSTGRPNTHPVWAKAKGNARTPGPRLPLTSAKNASAWLTLPLHRSSRPWGLGHAHMQARASPSRSSGDRA
mmetsp:Transcript_63201/g.188338  ORF Transcript_63201/g.188338 Transcript_63201/m.188338 type:complete len:271 (-) Transcript_63201:7-819(-)